jgi:sodium/bile acid cotransporter 7
LVLAVSSVVRLSREDFIAALFCSVKKTLAMGVPLAQLIFGARANLGLILLPIMFYHPFQLFVCGLLANQFAAQTGVGPEAPRRAHRPVAGRARVLARREDVRDL